MARGQGAAGRGGIGAPRRLTGERFVRVRDLAEAGAALERGITPVSAPGLAAFAGTGYWHAVEEALGQRIVIDCGEDAGLVLAAFRAGCRDLLFTGDADLARKLADMAEQLGAVLRSGLDGEILEPSPEHASFLPRPNTPR